MKDENVKVPSSSCKKGHWLYFGDEREIVCSICRKSYDLDFEIPLRVIKYFHYCPNCGSKLE